MLSLVKRSHSARINNDDDDDSPETRGKRPLGRDPDKSWCHRHTSVKLSWSKSMTPWTQAVAYECAAAQFMDQWAATKKVLHQCGGDISSCPGPYPSAACPEFHLLQLLGILCITTFCKYLHVSVYKLFYTHRTRAFVSVVNVELSQFVIT